jgi:hypothetical protein
LKVLTLTSILGELISLTDRNSEDVLRTIASSLPDLQPRGPRFVVARMGGTGSSWLAKLLNSHRDVFCSHEGVAARAFPAKQYSSDDIFRFLRWLAWDTMHGAYAATGDVGSVWQSHAAGLDGFRTALLMRHPARLLASRLATFPYDQSFTQIGSEADIREIWDIDISRFDPIDRVFVHDLHTFASQVWPLQRGVRIVHIEDLASPERCQEETKYLTGVDYPPDLIERAIRTPINQRSKPIPIRQIVSSFTARQRDWYRCILGDAAPELGYDLTEG